MPHLTADRFDVGRLEDRLRRYPELGHLRVRRHGALLVLESGPKGDAIPHARLRKATKQWWFLEIANHAGRWERVPIRDGIGEIIELLTGAFPWVLAPIENQERT